MGSFFTDLLSFDHEVAVLEQDPKRMRFIYNALRMQSVDEIDAFAPEMVINCVTLTHTLDAFRSVLPHLRPYCIISDIASVKTNLLEFYKDCGFPYVSTHPMFGPTFANLGNLMQENAIIISEGDHLGMPEDGDLPRPVPRADIPRELAVVPVPAGGHNPQLEQVRGAQAGLDEGAGALEPIRWDVGQAWAGQPPAGEIRHLPQGLLIL